MTSRCSVVSSVGSGAAEVGAVGEIIAGHDALGDELVVWTSPRTMASRNRLAAIDRAHVLRP